MNAAGGVLTAKQAPHRPGTAGARSAAEWADAILTQATFKSESLP
jgi:hypothetical protein